MAGNPNPKELMSQTGRRSADLGDMLTPNDITYGHGEQNPPDGSGESYFGKRFTNRNQYTKAAYDSNDSNDAE